MMKILKMTILFSALFVSISYSCTRVESERTNEDRNGNGHTSHIRRSAKKEVTTKYDSVYDSLYQKIYGMGYTNRQAQTRMRSRYDWKYFKRLWHKLNIADDDTVYIHNISFNRDGLSSHYTIMRSKRNALMNDMSKHSSQTDSIEFVELSSMSVSLLCDEWNPDSLREAGKKFEYEAAEIAGGGRSFTSTARIIIHHGDISIDTLSYGGWKTDNAYSRIYQKYMAEKSVNPHQQIYDKVFNDFWSADISSASKKRRTTAIDKQDFRQLWDGLEIQPIDTVYLSIFHGKDENGKSFRIALFQSRNISSWGYNPLPDSHNNHDRNDALLMLKSPTKMPGAWASHPYKHLGEGWERYYYKLYQLTPPKDRIRLKMERPQFGTGKHLCHVTNARIFIDGARYQIDTMSYTDNLSVSPAMFIQSR